MKKKQLTLHKLIFIYWGILLGIVLLLLLVYGGVILSRSRRDIRDSAEIIAKHYGSRLDKDITGMQEAVDSIFVNNPHYRRLWSAGLGDYEWVGSTYNINVSLQEKVDSLDYMGGMFFYDRKRDSMRSVYKEASFNGTKMGVDLALREALRGEWEHHKEHVFLEHMGEEYLVYFMKSRETYLGFIMNLDRYFDESEEITVLYVDRGDRIAASTGDGGIKEEDALEAISSGRTLVYSGDKLLMPVNLDSLDVSLAISMDSLNLLEIWEKPDLWVIVFLTPLALFAVLFLLLKDLREILLYPVEHTFHKIQEMTAGGAENIPQEKRTRLQIKEFVEIDHRIDEVLEQMVRLQEERFRERQRVKEVQLQYYQLQVNPHFFLNCLNTISTLLENHSVDVANDLIRSFSSYYRYIFRDQRQAVTVEEEVREVRAYCNIYSIKGGFPILLQADVKEEALDCRIPILCIQTFVENSIKHGMMSGTVLAIKIIINILEDEQGERRLSICITDNGSGYPEEILEELNQPVADFEFRSYHVGIDNLKYRLYLMYKEEVNWYFYNAPYGGGGITEITLPEVKDEHTDH